MLKQNYVLVIDTNKKPLTPCRPITARKLRSSGQVAVFGRFPLIIVIKKEVAEKPKSITIKLDPGSKTTGIALLQGNQVVVVAELTHGGQAIKASLESGRSIRRGRRNRSTRYPQTRLFNSSPRKGWLDTSLQHRVETTITWVYKIIQFAPVASIFQELVRFDLHQMENQNISCIEYQQAELAGDEYRKYLLTKWYKKWAYCDVENVPLQIEDIHQKAKWLTNQISNLSLAKNVTQKKKPKILVSSLPKTQIF